MKKFEHNLKKYFNSEPDPEFIQKLEQNLISKWKSSTKSSFFNNSFMFIKNFKFLSFKPIAVFLLIIITISFFIINPFTEDPNKIIEKAYSYYENSGDVIYYEKSHQIGYYYFSDLDKEKYDLNVEQWSDKLGNYLLIQKNNLNDETDISLYKVGKNGQGNFYENLSPEEFENIYGQSPENEVKYDIVCASFFETSKNIYSIALEIPEDNYSNYSLTGSGEGKVQDQDDLLSTIQLLDENKGVENAQTILKNLKESKNYKHYRTSEKGIDYFVFLEYSSEIENRYYINSQTYTLDREEIKNIKSGEIESRMDYLQRELIDINKSQKIFDPDTYGLLLSPAKDAGVNITKDVGNGCYNPNGEKMTEEQEKELWLKLPAKAKQKMDELARDMIISDIINNNYTDQQIYYNQIKIQKEKKQITEMSKDMTIDELLKMSEN
jgi:hypothetical protein